MAAFVTIAILVFSIITMKRERKGEPCLIIIIITILSSNKVHTESEASNYHDGQCGEMAMSTLWDAHLFQS